ncbi:lipoprotein [Streptomyces sp. NPDC005805]|uniref:lipoprotein n=1 Tax=Streptomyces sp. NPDC005805 TaxID=3157068 RepID=UPI0033CF600A
MRAGTRARARAVAAVLVLGALGGCATNPDASPAKPTGTAPEQAAGTEEGKDNGKDNQDAEAGGRPLAAKGDPVGPKGSACPMPVTFDAAEGWQPKPLYTAESDPNGDFAELYQRGPVTLLCEIDAKPAGHVGFLRVWASGKAGEEPRAVLRAFLESGGEGIEDEKWSTFRTGSLTGVEVAYTGYSELLEESKKQRAFAVPVPSGVAVVDLGGMDDEEHEAMLPAYELARQTLRTG